MDVRNISSLDLSQTKLNLLRILTANQLKFDFSKTGGWQDTAGKTDANQKKRIQNKQGRRPGPTEEADPKSQLEKSSTQGSRKKESEKSGKHCEYQQEVTQLRENRGKL